MKTCSKCGVPKELTDFQFRKMGRRAGCYEAACRVCVNARATSYAIKRRQENPEPSRALARKYYAANPEPQRARSKKRRLVNPEGVRRNQRDWEKRAGIKQLNQIIRKRLRQRIRNALNGFAKIAPTMTLLGCTIEEFKNYLESQFSQRPGMSWETKCFWHIDHIKPCVDFDLSDPEQQRKCFHYTNLQPLWAVENLQKSDS